jgi:hypothetical protein
VWRSAEWAVPGKPVFPLEGLLRRVGTEGLKAGAFPTPQLPFGVQGNKRCVVLKRTFTLGGLMQIILKFCFQPRPLPRTTEWYNHLSVLRLHLSL